MGYSVNIGERFNTHRCELRNGTHSNDYLQNAWNKYGEEAFKFEILEECSEEFLASNENYWANLLHSHNPIYGYNIGSTNPTARTGKLKPESVAKRTETRKINSQKRGYWVSEERRKKMSEDRKGKPVHPLMNINMVKKYSKAIIQLTEEGEVVAEYPSIKEAGRVNGFNDKNISSVCLGKRNKAHGFKWAYKENFIKEKK